MSSIPAYEVVLEYPIENSTEVEKVARTFDTPQEVDAFLAGYQVGRSETPAASCITINTRTSEVVPVDKPDAYGDMLSSGAFMKHTGLYKDECDCDYGTAHCPHVYEGPKGNHSA